MTENTNSIQAADGPSLPYIASRVLNRPLLLHPDKAQIVLEVLQGRIGVDQIVGARPDANRFIGKYRREDGRSATMRVQNGVAILPIVGSLVNRGAWIGTNSGLVSYEGVAAQLREAAADPEVSAILMDIDSPGGEATGMFGIACLVQEVNKTKPVVAMVNDVAASAAYGIASGAREIIVSPTSMVGSVGVVLTHLDRSAEMEQKGVKATLIHAGAHKVDGNSLGPLPESVRSDLQAEVMKFYDQFVGVVAAGRAGRMSEAQIRATEARVYLGADAVEMGLADRVAMIDEVIAEYSQQAHGATSKKGIAMSNPTTTAPQAENAGVTEDAFKAAVNQARAEGRSEGAAEATSRIKSILDLPEAEGRQTQALAFALETSMSAKEAKAVLGKSPMEATGAKPISYRAAAENEFGASDDPKPSNQDKSAEMWAKAIKNVNASI